MKLFLKIVVLINLIGMLINYITGNMNGVISNGFMATIIATLSNDY